MSTFTLADLEKRVHERAKASAEKSYTRSLIEKGVEHCAKKFGEEAVEAVIAAASGDTAALTAETADVLYHLAVMLQTTGVSLDDVYAELARRTGQSGHAEKASRTKS